MATISTLKPYKLRMPFGRPWTPLLEGQYWRLKNAVYLSADDTSRLKDLERMRPANAFPTKK